MLRVSEIKLPLDHGPDALKGALLKKLRLSLKELVRFAVFKRGVDARKKSAILYAYIVDAEVADEADVLRRVKNDPHVTRTPNMDYPGAIGALPSARRDRRRAVRAVRRAYPGASGIPADHRGTR